MMKLITKFFSKKCNDIYDAISNDDFITLEKLLKAGHNPNQLDEYGQTPIFRIVYNSSQNQIALLKILIEYGADVNFQKPDGAAALHHAKKISLANTLIENGANVKLRNKGGSTVLHYQNENRLATLYLSLGIDVNDKDKLDNTPLHSSIYSKSEFIKFLIEQGANVNLPNINGWTPLIMLCMTEYADHNDNIDIIKKIDILLASGANLNAKDNRELNSYNHALMVNNNELAEYLKEKGIQLQ
jgi:ankyrin repeat protein